LQARTSAAPARASAGCRKTCSPLRRF